MKKTVSKNNSPEKQLLDTLKKLTGRIEEAVVDISDIKSDLNWANLRLTKVERNTEITKVDVEKIKEGVKEIKRNLDDLTEMTAEILKKAATRDELNDISQRVTVLEQS